MPRILIVKTSSLGDVVHNLPAISDIHIQFPQAQIDWVVEDSFAAIPSLHPAVSNVIMISMRRWKHAISSRQTWREIKQLRLRLRAERYDAIVDTQGLLKSAVVGSFAQGCHHGHDQASVREPLASFFYDRKHAIARDQHAVTRNRLLAAQALGYAMPETLPNYGLSANPHLPALAIDLPDRYIVGLHATSRDAKLWPVDHWIALARHLSDQDYHLALPWNSDAERSRAQTISRQVAGTVVLPRMPLNDMAAVLADAKAAVGVDTGLSHLAAALDVPTVAIYTDTTPSLTGVYGGAVAPAINLGGKARIPTVEEVTLALRPLLAA